MYRNGRCVFEIFITLTMGKAKKTGHLLDVGSIIPAKVARL